MHCPAQTALFSVPSTDPLQNQGPLQPVFEDILGDLRGRRLAARLQLTLARLQPGVIAALRDGWLRAIETRLRSQRQRHAERLFTRRRFLLKGLLILSVALALGGRVAGYETGIMRTIGESLIIGGWAGGGLVAAGADLLYRFSDRTRNPAPQAPARLRPAAAGAGLADCRT